MKKTLMLSIVAAVVCLMSSCNCCPNSCNKSACGTKACAIDTIVTIQTPALLYGAELEWEAPAAGVKRQIMGYNDHIMMVKVDFEAGSDGGGAHAHPHTQSTVVVSGVFDVTIDGVTQTLKAGDGFYVAPNKTHMAVCKEAGMLIDAFSPIRETFVKK